MTLRELMTNEIRNSSWLDYCYERGDNAAINYKTYEDWLNSLSDSEFLDTYRRVLDIENKLDEM